MRAVEDYHVDRLGVEVWQHMELTSTNRPLDLASIGLYMHKQYQSIIKRVSRYQDFRYVRNSASMKLD